MRDLPQIKRTQIVNSIIPLDQPNIKHVSSASKDFDELFKKTIAEGGEGLILKKLDAPYRHDGVADNRSSAWLKAKKSETDECVIIGLQTGEGKFAHLFGALILGQYVAGKLTEVARCSGMTDDMRHHLLHEVSKLPESGDALASPTHTLCTCIPKIVVEVSFMERTEYGMMRMPQFVRIRTDKAPADCVFEGTVGKKKKGKQASMRAWLK
jgi:ATP-dependent DNA ligase